MLNFYLQRKQRERDERKKRERDIAVRDAIKNAFQPLLTSSGLVNLTNYAKLKG